MEKYGFVYIWRDKKHNRYYIGCHFGTVDDGYICSSRWMRKARKRRLQDFKRRILSTKIKTMKEMFEEEYRWLQMIDDSELKTKYYNLHRNHSNHFWGDEKKAKSAVEKMAASLRKRNAAMTPEERSEKFGVRKGKPSPRKGKTMEEEYGPEKAAHLKSAISEKLTGYKHSPEVNAKKGSVPWNKGKTGIYSEETKKRMGWAKGKKIGDRLSDEGRKSIGKKNSNRMKEKWQDPKYRKMMMEARS
jgi:hypothetical protein